MGPAAAHVHRRDDIAIRLPREYNPDGHGRGGWRQTRVWQVPERLRAGGAGRRLGIFKPHEEKTKAARERERGEQFWIELCGRPVPAKNTADGIRAVSGRAAVTAESAEAYLETKCGDHLEAARAAIAGQWVGCAHKAENAAARVAVSTALSVS